MAEAMADLKRLGIGVTRRGYIHARPDGEMVEHARRMHARPPIAPPKNDLMAAASAAERPGAGTLSEQLAGFAAGPALRRYPPEVVARVRLHTLDIIGVCLLGAPMEFARILRAVASASGGAPESTLMGCGGLKLPATQATRYNGGLAHGNEFDDTYSAGRWHGSAAVAPAHLAAAEMLHAGGKAFITALTAGLEAGCRLTRAAPGLLTQGFHSTCTAGVFRVIPVGRQADGPRPAGSSADALGICGSFASGTAEFLSDPEPWSKRIQVGYAGQGAIVAARAAAAGFKGPRSIFEGRHGYFRAYARDGITIFRASRRRWGATGKNLSEKKKTRRKKRGKKREPQPKEKKKKEKGKGKKGKKKEKEKTTTTRGKEKRREITPVGAQETHP